MLSTHVERQRVVVQYNHNHGEHGHFASGGGGGLAGKVGHVRAVKTQRLSNSHKAALGVAAVGALGALGLAAHIRNKRTHVALEKKRAFDVDRSQHGLEQRVHSWISKQNSKNFPTRIRPLSSRSVAGSRAITHAEHISTKTGVAIDRKKGLGMEIMRRLTGEQASYSPDSKSIAVLGHPHRDSLANAILHEHAHAFEHRAGHLTAFSEDGSIKDPKQYYRQEMIAEAAAHIVARHHGLDTSAFSVPYIGTYHLAHQGEGGKGLDDPSVQRAINETAAQMLAMQ